MFDNDLSSTGFYSTDPPFMAIQYQATIVMSSSCTDGKARIQQSAVKLNNSSIAGCNLRNKEENGLPVVGIPEELFLDNTFELVEDAGSSFSKDPRGALWKRLTFRKSTL